MKRERGKKKKQVTFPIFENLKISPVNQQEVTRENAIGRHGFVWPAYFLGFYRKHGNEFQGFVY